MKILNILALITSTLAVGISALQQDWTETAAWFCLALYNLKDVLDKTQ